MLLFESVNFIADHVIVDILYPTTPTAGGSLLWHVYICKADFSVTGINGTDDPLTASYDFQFDEEDYELIVDCE